MKTIRFSMVLLVLLTMISGSAFADQYYEIENYDIKIEVSKQNVYQISETLEVLFKQPRHGIFRKIPVMYYGYAHEIDDILVYDPLIGVTHPFDVSRAGSEVEIKVGDADVYVEGNQYYKIDYTYDGGDDQIDEYDEFYFNILGTEWDTTIDKVTFQIDMPRGFDAEKLNITLGRYGSTDNTRVQWEVRGQSIIGHAENLMPNEGITVALNLDEGYYVDVSSPYNMIWIYLLLILLVGLLIGANVIRSRNYRQNKIIPVLNFYPPMELNSAELAYVYKEERLSHQDISTLIICWASKGYLRIHEEEKSGLFGKDSLMFEKLKDGNDLPNLYERSLFSDLFSYGYGDTVRIDDLKNVFYKDLDIAKGFIRDEYRNDHEILENKYQYGIIGVSLLVMLLTSAVLAIYLRVLMGVPYLVAMIPTGMIMLIFWGIAMAISTRRKGGRKKRIFAVVRSVVLIAILVQMAAFLGTILRSVDFSLFQWNSLTTLVLISMALFIATIFSIGKVKRYTPFAKKLLDNIYGFKDFLETAKLDKMEMIFEQNPEYFYDMLPYVMVFDLTKIWDQTMQQMALTGPTWYVSSRPFNAYYMMGAMDRSMTEMTTRPQSSGSGGGGSVGGGGGGGGGGSW